MIVNLAYWDYTVCIVGRILAICTSDILQMTQSNLLTFVINGVLGDVRSTASFFT